MKRYVLLSLLVLLFNSAAAAPKTQTIKPNISTQHQKPGQSPNDFECRTVERSFSNGYLERTTRYQDGMFSSVDSTERRAINWMEYYLPLDLNGDKKADHFSYMGGCSLTPIPHFTALANGRISKGKATIDEFFAPSLKFDSLEDYYHLISILEEQTALKISSFDIGLSLYVDPEGELAPPSLMSPMEIELAKLDGDTKELERLLNEQAKKQLLEMEIRRQVDEIERDIDNLQKTIPVGGS